MPSNWKQQGFGAYNCCDEAGVTFDLPEGDLKSVRWLGEGPFRVWQNRLRRATLGVHEIARNDNQPGATWLHPGFQGCFAGCRWARLNTTRGPLIVTGGDSRTYLRIGTPRIDFPFTSPACQPRRTAPTPAC